MADDTDPFLQRVRALSSDGQTRTVGMAVIVSALAALVVSLAAVTLQPRIDANLEAERQARLDRLIDSLPGLADILAETGADTLETMIVSLETGQPVADPPFETFEMSAVAADPETSTELSDDQDVAGIGRRPDYSEIHVLKSGREVALVILPVYGAGYQSTLRAYLALEGDLTTVAGFVVTEQAETPGLGAKIEDASWQALWPGTKLIGPEGDIRFEVVRGKAQTDYQIDGITGATRTSNGVEGMVRFWIGPHGYGPVLDAIDAGEV